MVGRINEPTIGDLGQLIGLLSKYQDHLIYLAHEGLLEGEHPQDSKEREKAIDIVSACIHVVYDDLAYRLENY